MVGSQRTTRLENIDIHMYICMFICLRRHMNIHTYVCISICLHMYICILIYLVYICIFIFICLHIYMCIETFLRARSAANACPASLENTHIYKCIYIDTCINTQI